MDKDTDDDVEIILSDFDMDEDDEMEGGEGGEEWFGNAGV